MELFLLRREFRCVVTALLLSAVKTDKDSGEVRDRFFLAHLVYQPKSLIQLCFVRRESSLSGVIVIIVCAHPSCDRDRSRNFMFGMCHGMRKAIDLLCASHM